MTCPRDRDRYTGEADEDGNGVPDECAITADLDGDGTVGPGDLAVLLGAWGVSAAADLDGDGTTGPLDLALLLAAWGTSP